MRSIVEYIQESVFDKDLVKKDIKNEQTNSIKAKDLIINYFEENWSKYKEQYDIKTGTDMGHPCIIIELEDKLFRKIKNLRDIISKILSDNDIHRYSANTPMKMTLGNKTYPWHMSITFYNR